MTSEPATDPGYRFPAEVIQHAVWLYHVFSLSLRDVELILAERGVTVSHESIRLTFGGEFRPQAASAATEAGRHLALG
jgi:putative transposase